MMQTTDDDDRATGTPLRFEVDDCTPTTAVISAQDAFLLAGTRCGKIQVWDLRTLEWLGAVAARIEPVTELRPGEQPNEVYLRCAPKSWQKMTLNIGVDGLLSRTRPADVDSPGAQPPPSHRWTAVIDASDPDQPAHIAVHSRRPGLDRTLEELRFLVGPLKSLGLREAALHLDSAGELFAVEDAGSALAWMDRLMVLGPSPVASLFYLRASLCRAVDDRRGYYFDIKTALARKFDDPSLVANLSCAEEEAAQKSLLPEDEALSSGSLDPDEWRRLRFASCHHNVGVLFASEGHHEQAVAAFINALYIRPQAASWYFCGQSLRESGHPVWAHWAFEQLDGCTADDIAALHSGFGAREVSIKRIETAIDAHDDGRAEALLKQMRKSGMRPLRLRKSTPSSKRKRRLLGRLLGR